MSAEAAILVRGLGKTYGGGFEALRGIDLEVRPGEVFAILGPNGAGKTTTVEILEGYRDRTRGEVRVLGRDPRDANAAWRSRLGIVLQECRLTGELTVAETLSQFAAYYPDPLAIEQAIELVGLGEKADERVSRLSGGQQRRLDVGVALVGNPELLFLDEPTTGFDPSARRQAWAVVGSLRELGKTVILTTHYMDEAQALADRVAVIARGSIVEVASPDALGGRRDAASRISFSIPAGSPDPPARLGSLEANGSGRLTLTTRAPVEALNELTAWAIAEGVELVALEVSRPSLEDVYLGLVGEDARR